MENLVRKLQEEVGLTEEQAVKSVIIMKEFMSNGGVDVDWDKLFKLKYEEFANKAKDIYSNVSKQTQSYTDKIADKVDKLAVKAKKSAHDLSVKAADFFDDKKEE